MNVLFVDDDPVVLSVLEAALRRQAPAWTLDFAGNGTDALRKMEAAPRDAIVVDLYMPEMDGATLLEAIERRWPTTLRVILSGHTDRDAILRSMRHAHQFLGKPPRAETLVALLERLRGMQSQLQWPQIRETLSRTRDLPPAPTTYLQLMRLLRQPECSADKVTAIVERDPAVAAKVLRLANSAYFRRSQPVRSIAAAIVRLGLSALVTLVLSAETFPETTDEHQRLADMRARSLLACLVATHIAPGDIDRDAAASAALLADIGPLLLGHLIQSLPQLPAPELRQLQAQVGADLLGLWGLPDAIVVAVAHQLRPAAVEPDRFDVTATVHVATALARSEEPDAEYLAELGVADRLPRWQHVAGSLRRDAGA